MRQHPSSMKCAVQIPSGPRPLAASSSSRCAPASNARRVVTVHRRAGGQVFLHRLARPRNRRTSAATSPPPPAARPRPARQTPRSMPIVSCHAIPITCGRCSKNVRHLLRVARSTGKPLAREMLRKTRAPDRRREFWSSPGESWFAALPLHTKPAVSPPATGRNKSSCPPSRQAVR